MAARGTRVEPEIVIFMKSILRLGALSFLAAALLAAPAPLQAQNTNKPSAKSGTENKTSKGDKKAGGHPFHGKLAELNKTAKTITVGKSVIQITSETKIKKADKPATLEDGVVGEPVSGYVKPNADGKAIATSVAFGAKPDSKGSEKKKSSSDK
jgi:hypothetical protein